MVENGMSNNGKQKKSHVCLFTSPGIGHLVPFCQLARRLAAADFGCKVTITVLETPTSARQAAPLLRSLEADAALDVHVLRIDANVPPNDDSDSDSPVEARIVRMVARAVPQVVKFVAAAGCSAFVVDFFCSPAIAPAAAAGVPSYVFLAMSAAMLSMMFSLPTLTAQLAVDLKDLDLLGVQLPGLPAMAGRDLPTPLQERAGAAYAPFVEACLKVRDGAGVLVNSSRVLEGAVLDAFAARWGRAMPHVYAVGPMNAAIGSGSSESFADGLRWLDAQPPDSVVFVSFGSGAAPTEEQLEEIAAALEHSRQRFLWVVRKRRAADAANSYFAIADANVAEMLPAGFAERTRGRGIVVPSWAPQPAVLAHAAVGGFVSHCGWNSCVESVMCGVPVLTWPMFAEQRFNGVVLRQVFGTGMGLRMRDEDGFVCREDLQSAVTELMQGEHGRALRERSKKLQKEVKEGLQPGGCSWTDLAAAVSHWTSHHHHSPPPPPPGARSP